MTSVCFTAFSNKKHAMTDLWFTGTVMWRKIAADRVCHRRNTEPPGCKGQNEYPKCLVQRKEEWGACLALAVGEEDGGIESRGGGESDTEGRGMGHGAVMSAPRSNEVCDLQFCNMNLSFTTVKPNGEKSYMI